MKGPYQGNETMVFNISAAMSLLLCVLIFGLWLRSYTSRDEVLWMSWNSKIVDTPRRP